MKNGLLLLPFLIVGVSLVFDQIAALKHLAPVLDLPPGSNDHYHGLIKETDTVVSVSPEIRVLPGTGPVCSYAVSAMVTEATTIGSTSTSTKKAKKQEEIDRRAAEDKPKAGVEKEASEEEDDDDDDDDDSSEEESTTTTIADLSTDSADLPFRVEVSEKSNGRAIIRLKDDAVLDCARASYKFKIAPKRCGDDLVTGDSSIGSTRGRHEQSRSGIYEILVHSGSR